MDLRFIAAGVALSVGASASAEVVALNSSKALTVYDGGNDVFLLSAWSYNGGTPEQNKLNSFKSWISFDNSSLTRSWIQGGEMTITQWNNGQVAIAAPVTFDLYALTDVAGDAWTNAMTWQDAPGNDAASARLLNPANTVLAGSMTITGAFPARGTVLSFPLNEEGVNFLKGDLNGISTFIMTAHDDRSYVTGLQAYTTAHLNVAIPEPTVIGGILSASLGLLLRKRK